MLMYLFCLCLLLQVEATPEPVLTCAVSGTTLHPGVATHPAAVPPVPVAVQPAAPDVTVDQEVEGYISFVFKYLLKIRRC